MSDTNVKIPDIKEILATGLQFGHSVSRWNPKMSKFIWGQKNGIHVVDIAQTREALATAATFLQNAAAQGEVVFVGTKRQAAELVKQNAMRAGAHFVVDRWPGGLLTNFKMSQRSIQRLNSLEKMFEEGVEGRTKYEVSKMKVEWGRLNRLYGGIKTLTARPVAVIVVDPRFEKVAVREARRVNVPVVALTDTNCDPTMVDYCIPGNDDALKAVEMVITTLADAVLAGNQGKGVKHTHKDYSTVEIKLVRTNDSEASTVEEVAATEDSTASEAKSSRAETPARKVKSAGTSKGILELAKEKAVAEQTEEKKSKPAKSATKKATK